MLFNEGLAYIGLGNIKPGEKLAEGAIAEPSPATICWTRRSCCANTPMPSSMPDT